MPKIIESIKDKLFENIFNNAHNGIAIVGIYGNWVKINQSVVNMLGYTEEEMYGMTFQEITHKDDLELDLNNHQKLLDGDIDRYQIEKRYFHKKGTVIWVLLSVSLQSDEHGVALYFISQMVNITSRKEISWQMDAISEIAKKQNEKLTDFAHIATHDIRTHIGNLNTITDFIEEDVDGLDYVDNFKMLKEAIKQLEDTISNLNEVRKEEFSPSKDLKSLRLNTFVDNAIYNVSSIAKHEQCQIINNTDPSVMVLGKKVYLDSIILNLLTNGIKYASKERKAVLELNSFLDGESVILEIKDNGLGIDLKKHREDLFKFEKTFHDHSEARGIGLFITKNHVESIGGKIEVESEVGIGSRFMVYFKRG